MYLLSDQVPKLARSRID